MTTEMTREETRLAQALAAYGIGPEHVVSSRVYPDAPTRLHPFGEPVSGVVIVTRAGQKLRWQPGQTVAPLTPGERGDRIPCNGTHPEPRSYSADWRAQLGELRAVEIEELTGGTICPRCIHYGTKGGPNVDAFRKAQARMQRVIGALDRAKIAPPPMPPTPPAPAGRSGSQLERALANAVEKPFDFTGV